MAISAQELNIILSARDKEFAKAMAANQRRVERFASKSQKELSAASKSFDMLGAAAKRFLPALAAGAVVAAVKNVTSAMDEIGKKADAIGIGTDALQELRAVAVSAGVSQGGLDKALEQLSKRLGEAEQGTGTAVKALEAMGLTAQELTGIPLDQALGVIAGRFAKLQDATDRTAVSTQLFGREGVAMVNVLKGGASELEKARKRFRDLGVVIDEELIRNAEEMQDRFDAASTVIGAQFSTVLGRLAPLLVRAAENAASLAIAIADIVDAVDDFVSGNDSVDIAIRETVISMGGEIRASQALEQQLARGGKMSVEIARKKLEEARARQEAAKATLDQTRAQRLESDAYKDAQEKIDRLSKSSRDFDFEEAKRRLRAARPGGIGQEELQALAEQQLETINSQLLRAIAARDELLSEAAPEQLRDHLERATANVVRLQEALKKAKDGVIDLGKPIKPVELPDRELKKTATQAPEKTAENLEAVKNEAVELDQTIESLNQNLIEAFENMFSGTMKVEDAFKKMAASIISDLLRIESQKLMQAGEGGLAGGLLGGLGQLLGGAGGFLSDLFGGDTDALGGGFLGIAGHAQGGTIQSGQPSIVGEHGRELFVPSSAGRILSVPQTKDALGGGGGVTVQQTINVSTGVQQTVRAEIQSLMPQIAAASTKAVLDARRRGGSFAGAFA
jgi:hypothetical protein